MKNFSSIFLSLIISAYYCNYAQAKELKIGAIVELSGSGAILGNRCRQGIELAAEYYKDSLKETSLSVVYGDSQGDAKTGIAEFNKLLQQDMVSAVIVMRSQIAMPINPFSKNARIPLLGVVGHSRFVQENSYAIRTYPVTEQEAKMLSDKAFQLKLHRVAVITLEDEWTLSLTKHFENYIKSNSANIVFSDTILPNEVDFLSLIAKLKKSEPDLIFVNVGVAQYGVIIKKLREQGLNQQLFSTFWANDAGVVNSAGYENIKGTYFVSVPYDRSEFSEVYHKSYPHEELREASYYCFSAYATLASALNGQNTNSKLTFNEKLKSLNSLKIPGSNIEIKNGELIYDLVLRQF